jgi:MFS superfamily sulfate permease-like transporter
MKTVLRGKHIALSTNKKKRDRTYTSSLTAHLKAREQNEANSPKRSRLQKIFKLRAEINLVETKRIIQRTNQSRSWFFEKINKINKYLARQTREHRDSLLINKIRNKKGVITTEREEIQNIIRACKKRIYSTNLENLDEMDNFLNRCQVPKLNQDQNNDLNSPISPKEIEAVFNSLPNKQTKKAQV